MKKILLGAALTISACSAVLLSQVLAVTDPYIVKPIASQAARAGLTSGHFVDGAGRVLSVLSSNDVVVVADPGASFSHEVLWLVEQTRKTGDRTLMEFTYVLPQHAAPEHIKPLGSQVPAKLMQLAGVAL
jgi:hypothetical protein